MTDLTTPLKNPHDLVVEGYFFLCAPPFSGANRAYGYDSQQERECVFQHPVPLNEFLRGLDAGKQSAAIV